ncbi:unnamed protein product [Absidia cylindrospora]
MGGVYISFEDQKNQESDLTIKAMAAQIGINLGIAILITIVFCFLRPKHTLVYAPKYKYSTDLKKPPMIGMGLFAWVKPLLTAKDDFLLERIGYDAVLFLRFLRLLRHLLLVMSIVGVCALIPVNIVATRFSGDWPPSPGIDFLSISGINYVNGKLSTDPDLRWYWSPFAATWFFTLVIGYFLHRFSNEYIRLRQQYFQQEENGNETAKTILVSYIPEHKYVESMGVLPHPITDCSIGHANSKLTSIYEEHELAVEHLEIALASYLNENGETTTYNENQWLSGIWWHQGNVIEYYTKQVSDLDKTIKDIRHGKSKAANFGWLSFAQVQHAQAAETALNQYAHQPIFSRRHRRHSNEHDTDALDARPSPPARDLLWANLPLDKPKRQMKRWFGRLVYFIFTLAWMIPIGALSATSNLINLIRMIPNSDSFIENNAFFMGMVQAYFTPIIMALFFLLLPFFFRFISQQQGYRTQTTLDRKVFLKLYAFFIINNLLVFTLVSIFVGIYGQIRALIAAQALADNNDNVADYVLQMAKNISAVSSFWIDYVCIKGLGLTMELCQMMPLAILTIRKWISRPSPRQLREYARPPAFDYPQGYSILVFFFTIALLYSAMAPLILPFALMYFTIASLVYKYMLMYIYVTKMESGGKMWPVLFQTINVGVVLFQIIMIIVLSLKGGHLQSYCMIPLPILTVVYQWFYQRRLTDINCYILDPKTSKWLEQQQQHQSATAAASPPKKSSSTKIHSLKSQFRDPAAHHKLSSPMVHDDVKHLLPQVYHQLSHPKETIEMMSTKKHKQTTTTTDAASLSKKRQSHVMKMDLDEGLAIKFCTMTEDDVIETAMDDYEEEDDEEEDDDGNHLGPTQQRHELAYHPASEVKNGKLAEILDTDDEMEEEQRGLVQNDHMDQFWQQHSNNRPSMHSTASLSSSLYTNLLPPPMGSTKILMDQDMVLPPMEVTPDQDVLDWKLQRKGVTSEFVDLYESFPAQSITEEEEDLALYLSCRPSETYMERRQSAPLITLVDDNDRLEEDDDADIPYLRRAHSMVMPTHVPGTQHNSDILNHRRLSQPSLTQYARRPRRRAISISSTTTTQRRRHSMPSAENNTVENERQGAWISSLDYWRAQPQESNHPPHQLTRSMSVLAPEGSHHSQRRQNNNNPSLQRSQTLQQGRSLMGHHQQQQQQQQTHYLNNNDGRIRITYYDDLLEHPDDDDA